MSQLAELAENFSNYIQSKLYLIEAKPKNQFSAKTLSNREGPSIPSISAQQQGITETAETSSCTASNPNPRISAREKRVPTDERCEYCKRAGHKRDDCRHLHPHLRLVRRKGETQGSVGGGRGNSDRCYGEKRQQNSCGQTQKLILRNSPEIATPEEARRDRVEKSDLGKRFGEARNGKDANQEEIRSNPYQYYYLRVRVGEW
jgi:hypothetical protein